MSIDYSLIKVLMIDDTAFMRSSLVKTLIELGFSRDKIFQAENGNEGFEALKASSQKFDLVLCDWNMPIMTGLELLKLVRSSNEYFKTIPFILITTASEKDKVIEAIQHKVSGYLLKPVQNAKLMASLETIFNKDIEDEV